MAATEVSASAKEIKDAQISSLTGMRGFAALMVVVIHTAGRTEYPWFGVHGYGPIALFVLSGFLLYRPFARWILGGSAMPDLRNFAIRRVFRIFPAYLVVLFVWMLAYPKAVPADSEGWLRALTLTSTYDFFRLTPGLEQTWSLGTELSWYVALPFLAMTIFFLVHRLPQPWALRAHVGILLTSLPASYGWMYWYHHNPDAVSESMWLPNFLMCFAFGALVALMMEAERAGISDISRGRKLMQDPWLLPILAIIFVAAATSEWAGPHDFGETMTFSQDLVRTWSSVGLAGTLLVISIFSGPRAPVVRLMSSRWMQATGRWSYGIYLWHLPLIVLLWEEFTFDPGVRGFVIWLAVVVPISYLLGAATYAWVEIPTIAWSHRVAARFTGDRGTGGGKRAARATPGSRGAVDSSAGRAG